MTWILIACVITLEDTYFCKVSETPYSDLAACEKALDRLEGDFIAECRPDE